MSFLLHLYKKNGRPRANASYKEHSHSLDDGIFESTTDHEIHRSPHCALDRFPDEQYNGFMIRINRDTPRASA